MSWPPLTSVTMWAAPLDLMGEGGHEGGWVEKGGWGGEHGPNSFYKSLKRTSWEGKLAWNKEIGHCKEKKAISSVQFKFAVIWQRCSLSKFRCTLILPFSFFSVPCRLYWGRYQTVNLSQNDSALQVPQDLGSPFRLHFTSTKQTLSSLPTSSSLGK